MTQAVRLVRTRPKNSDRVYPDGMILNSHGNPTKGIANTMSILTSDDAWDGVLAYDLFSESVTKLSAPPVRTQDGVAETGAWTDADTTRTAAWIASNCGFEPTAGHVDAAVEAVAKKNAYHPVRDYLTRLTWDGVPRLEGWLAHYFGAEDGQYSRAIGPKWLISAVARVMAPGCKADCMLVLEGPQGRKKSTALRVLFRDQWFCDTPPRIGEKDSYLALRAKWCIEFGELDSLRGRAITAVKNYLSAVQDSYRPPYGRRTQDFPRQCVFAGSTNETEYLQDPTGNRRFWPVAVGHADISALTADRDQLWAEAFSRYRNGEAWYLDTVEAEAVAREAQAEREVDDAWTAVIASWLDRKTAPSDYIAGAMKCVDRTDGVTTHEVMTEALGLKGADLSRHDLVTRCGQSLRRLGWEPRQVRRSLGRVRVYRPPASQPSESTSQVATSERA